MSLGDVGAFDTEQALYDPDWDTFDGLTSEEADVYAELHQLALHIFAQQSIVNQQLNNISHADAVVDWAQLTQAAANVATLRAQFNTLRTRIDAGNAPQQRVLSGFSATIGSWVTDVQHAIAAALAFIPETVAQALGRSLQAVTKEVGGALTPIALYVGLGVLGLIALTRNAERTRTYKRYVA